MFIIESVVIVFILTMIIGLFHTMMDYFKEYFDNEQS